MYDDAINSSVSTDYLASLILFCNLIIWDLFMLVYRSIICILPVSEIEKFFQSVQNEASVHNYYFTTSILCSFIYFSLNQLWGIIQHDLNLDTGRSKIAIMKRRGLNWSIVCNQFSQCVKLLHSRKCIKYLALNLRGYA